jgi:regulator of replication initiation timing
MISDTEIKIMRLLAENRRLQTELDSLRETLIDVRGQLNTVRAALDEAQQWASERHTEALRALHDVGRK